MKRLLIALALTAIAASPAHSRDGWQGRPSVCGNLSGDRLTDCQNWASTTLTPDTRTSCCGEADAYIADDYEYDPATGAYYAIISIDYPATDFTPAIPKGSKILIPPEKTNNAVLDHNPTGHGVVWIAGVMQVRCYFRPTGS